MAVAVDNGRPEFSRMANGEKKWQQKTVGRDSGDDGVAIMAVAVEDGGCRQ
jgi:hypothetical protein